MEQIFKDALHDRLGTWPLAYIPYGGADYGEVISIARAVGDGDDAVFHSAWVQAADRLVAEGDAALVQGHRASARELFLRAACFYGKSYQHLLGKPVDPLSSGSQAFFDLLQCPKQLIRFTVEEDADGHCEMGNRSLLNRRTLDWLDSVL